MLPAAPSLPRVGSLGAWGAASADGFLVSMLDEAESC